MSLNGWQNLNLSTQEKDILALRIGGMARHDTAKKLAIPIEVVTALEKKIEAGFKSEFLNMSAFDRFAKKEAVFRRIVNSAMQDAGVEDIDEKVEVMVWAIGEDYQTLPHQLWPERMRERIRLIGIDAGSPVKAVIRAACQVWKNERIVIPVRNYASRN